MLSLRVKGPLVKIWCFNGLGWGQTAYFDVLGDGFAMMCGADVVRALLWLSRVGDEKHLDKCRMLEEKELAQPSTLSSSAVRMAMVC